ncbi:MAG: class I adenylate-forming enzyme family protein [Vicinamibacterales bacterium]
MPRDTLIDYFDDLSRAKGPFLVYDDGFRARSHSYVEVGRAARGFASRLVDAGVRKGDKVVFWSENRPEWIVAFWGCLLGGVIVVPIDYRASPELLARITARVAARLVLVGEDVPPVPQSLGVPVWRLHELEWRDGAPPAVIVLVLDRAVDPDAVVRDASGAFDKSLDRRGWSHLRLVCSSTRVARRR